ncbi:MAG TPA: hypothetical protein VF816_15995 [Rhodocyclaceae bacterium]
MSSPPTDPSAEPHHRFIVVVPVADRPQHLRAFLASLADSLQRFPYGDGRLVQVLIADDSMDAACIADNRALAARYDALGLPCLHFVPDAQAALVDALGPRARFRRIVGDAPRERFAHKGQGAMRNIAYLKLARLLRDAPNAERTLIWSVDSDQEFKVKIETSGGDEEVALDFFHALDAVFSRTDALVATGKVVGDPPVSPAVMTNNFLDDVLAFLRDTAARKPDAACSHHAAEARRQGEAAYHDMADLFGFAPAEPYRYRCTLAGDHAEADCFAHFAFRLGGFFHGEHPTRVSYYQPGDALASLQAARTVYAGNYVFRAAALDHFLPFANLRLRMSGPTLGRLLRARLGPRFVSANLPMLHRRTVEGTSQAEFRPGIAVAAERVDMSGEFERQFYGDVMLFAIERLTDGGFPQRQATDADIDATLDGVREEMLARYNARHAAIRAKLEAADALLRDEGNWWNRAARHAPAVQGFAAFFANVARNFAEDGEACRRINAADGWARWRADLGDAVKRYPGDCDAWRQALAA